MGTRVPLAEAALLGTLPRHVQEVLLAAAVPVRLPAQEWLLRAGDPADRLYFVLSGRLRVVVERDGESRVARLVGPGAAIGELAVLTDSPRSASVQAVRDTDLLALAGDEFLTLLSRDRELGLGVATSLARQLQQSGGLSEPDALPTVFALVDAPETFSRALCDAFAELGATVAVDGPPGEDWARALAGLEDEHAYVVLLAGDGPWREFCLRQADRVVVVATGAPPADVDVPEGADLVFFDAAAARTLGDWRTAVSPRAHHVVTAGDGGAAARVVRRLTGRSLGLVLSGGGARAFAHLGVVEVLAAAGLEFDRLGGTSMGAFLASMVALGWSPERTIETVREQMAGRAMFSDYTVPRHSLLRGRRGESMLHRVVGDVWVEELPRPWFAISADLVHGRMVVHRERSLVDAIATSMSIPGLVPPRRYKDQLLIDGGILNNLPVDVMVADEPGPVVAVDVMRVLDTDDVGTRAELPTILETISRATVLSSVARAEATRRLAQVVISPSVTGVALRDFRRLDQALDAGRRAAEEALESGALEALAPTGGRPAAPVLPP
jgi:NTE family protein